MPADPARSTNLVSALEIDRLVRERQLQIAFDHGRFALFPLFISILCYTGLLANFMPRRALVIWLVVILSLLALRGVLTLTYARTRDKNPQWVSYQAVTMAALGLAYGVTPLWISLPEQAWWLAVVNLWLGGLAVAAVMGQGIVPVLGLSFAIPMMAPLLFKLFVGSGPTLVALGIGNALFYMYVFTVVFRSQQITLSELHARVSYETIAGRLEAQRLQTEQLVNKLKREITRRKRVQAALRNARNVAQRQSESDHLTGLANQRSLDRGLAREWARAYRERQPISLILCDIDRFRAYNERYGHHAGDLCLARLASVVCGIANRPADLVARYGAEEFAVLLPETGEYAALEVAEAVRTAVYEQTILHGGSDVERVVTASCGVATIIPDDISRANDLIESAALALKRAKTAGRNCVYTVYGSAARDEI
jgi:diguanylate cyclase (GGDEF)-like protein